MDHIYNILNNKYLDSTVEFSIRFIQTELINRNLKRLNINHDVINRENEELINLSYNIFENETTTKSKKEQTPFGEYFKGKIFEFEIKLISKSLDNTHLNQKKNSLYCPDLFEFIKIKLHLLPLWTGLILRQCQNQYPAIYISDQFTRLTNNPVESYFGHLKNQILNRQKRLLPSELCSKLYLNIQAIFIEYKFPDVEISKRKREIEEVWKKGSKSKRNGTYYDSVNSFGQFDLRASKDSNPLDTTTYKSFKINCDSILIDDETSDDDSELMDYQITNDNKYYLILSYENNGSFANVIIQAFISLGENFFQKVFISN